MGRLMLLRPGFEPSSFGFLHSFRITCKLAVVSPNNFDLFFIEPLPDDFSLVLPVVVELYFPIWYLVTLLNWDKVVQFIHLALHILVLSFKFSDPFPVLTVYHTLAVCEVSQLSLLPDINPSKFNGLCVCYVLGRARNMFCVVYLAVVHHQVVPFVHVTHLLVEVVLPNFYGVVVEVFEVRILLPPESSVLTFSTLVAIVIKIFFQSCHFMGLCSLYNIDVMSNRLFNSMGATSIYCNFTSTMVGKITVAQLSSKFIFNSISLESVFC